MLSFRVELDEQKRRRIHYRYTLHVHIGRKKKKEDNRYLLQRASASFFIVHIYILCLLVIYCWCHGFHSRQHTEQNTSIIYEYQVYCNNIPSPPSLMNHRHHQSIHQLSIRSVAGVFRNDVGRNLFFSFLYAHHVLKCKHRLVINMNTRTVLKFQDRAFNFFLLILFFVFFFFSFFFFVCFFSLSISYYMYIMYHACMRKYIQKW